MNPETTKTIFAIYGGLLLACLLLAIPGIIWGRKEKLVVYHGKMDLVLSCLNFSNPNAAALMALAGLALEVDGELRGEQLRACVQRLLRIVNSEGVRAHAITEGAEAPRWFEGARTDEYVQRRASELLALFVSAQRQGCGVIWS